MSEVLVLVLTVTLVLGPVVGISFLMTSKNKKWKARGYYCLSLCLACFGFGFFYMAYTGENTAGYIWMAACAYGTFWAYETAKSIMIDR